MHKDRTLHPYCYPSANPPAHAGQRAQPHALRQQGLARAAIADGAEEEDMFFTPHAEGSELVASINVQPNLQQPRAEGAASMHIQSPRHTALTNEAGQVLGGVPCASEANMSVALDLRGTPDVAPTINTTPCLNTGDAAVVLEGIACRQPGALTRLGQQAMQDNVGHQHLRPGQAMPSLVVPAIDPSIVSNKRARPTRAAGKGDTLKMSHRPRARQAAKPARFVD